MILKKIAVGNVPLFVFPSLPLSSSEDYKNYQICSNYPFCSNWNVVELGWVATETCSAMRTKTQVKSEKNAFAQGKYLIDSNGTDMQQREVLLPHIKFNKWIFSRKDQKSLVWEHTFESWVKVTHLYQQISSNSIASTTIHGGICSLLTQRCCLLNPLLYIFHQTDGSYEDLNVCSHRHLHCFLKVVCSLSSTWVENVTVRLWRSKIQGVVLVKISTSYSDSVWLIPFTHLELHRLRIKLF